MFQLYLLLRLKNFGRIVIELGIFRHCCPIKI